MIVKQCPRCKSSDIVCDAVARWDPVQNDWVLSDVQSFVTCLACDADDIDPVDAPYQEEPS